MVNFSLDQGFEPFWVILSHSKVILRLFESLWFSNVFFPMTEYLRYLSMKLNVSVSYLCCFKPFVKFALRRFLLRWQARELADKRGRWLSRSPLRARFNSFAVHLSRRLLGKGGVFPPLTEIFATP